MVKLATSWQPNGEYITRLPQESPANPPKVDLITGYKLCMSNKSDLPEGWSMPDYMAKRVSNSLKKKPESPEDKLQKALDEVARDIALIEPDAKDWGWWITYLLEYLEGEAKNRRKLRDYQKMLTSLKSSLGS